MRKRALYLYLIASTEQNKKSHTYIGCTANFWRRLKQHNGELHGGPRITKKNNNYWVPLMIIEIPKDWPNSTKELKYRWKSKSRGILSRLHAGLEIANQYSLKRYYSDIILSSEHDQFLFNVKETLLHEKWQKKSSKA